MKDVKLSLPLTEVKKIARLTSLLPDMLRLSSPRPRRRHRRQLALPSGSNLTLNLCTLSFVLLLPHLPPLLTSPTVLPRESALVFADYLRFHFSVSKPKALRGRARGYLSELRQATRWSSEKSYSSFCSPFSPLNFLRLPLTSLCPLPLA